MENWSWLGIFEYMKIYNQTMAQKIAHRQTHEVTAIVDELAEGKSLAYYELDIRRLEKFYS